MIRKGGGSKLGLSPFCLSPFPPIAMSKSLPLLSPYPGAIPLLVAALAVLTASRPLQAAPLNPAGAEQTVSSASPTIPSISTDLLAAEPSSNVAPLATQLEQARSLRDRSDWAGAISIYQKLLLQYPDQKEVRRELADTYLQNRDYRQSAALLEELLTTQPTDIELQLQLGEAYSWSGKGKEATTLYQSILQLQPDNVKARMGIARLLTWQGKRRDAISLYEAILKDRPDNLNARLEEAQVLNWMGRQPKAIGLYDAVLSRDPKNLQAKLGKAQALSWAGNDKPALALYDGILATDPDNLQARLGRAEALGRSGRFRQSLALYESILKTHPDSAEAWQGQAQVTYKMGKISSAIALYQDALTRFPESEPIRLGLARLYAGEQQMGDAQNILQPMLDQQNWEALELLDDIRAVRTKLDFISNQFSNRSDWLVQQNTRIPLRGSSIIPFVRTGFAEFNQKGLTTVANIPLQAGIEAKVNQIALRGRVGVDLFDRLSAVPLLGFEASRPVFPQANLTGTVEYGAFKYSAQSLENNIRALRFGPTFSWAIDRNTSLLASLRLGSYSDGNFEKEFFFYLERRIGNFYIAGNLYHLSYTIQPPTGTFLNGYFAPSNYWYYSGELGWEGTIVEPVKCRFSVNLGGQTPEGGPAMTDSYQARCAARLSSEVEASLGYRIGSILSSGASPNIGQTLTAQLRFQF